MRRTADFIREAFDRTGELVLGLLSVSFTLAIFFGLVALILCLIFLAWDLTVRIGA